MAIITLNNNSLSSVTALPAGVGGKVLKVEKFINAHDVTTTSSSYSSFESFSFTPTSASSTIYFHLTLCYQLYGNATHTDVNGSIALVSEATGSDVTISAQDLAAVGVFNSNTGFYEQSGSISGSQASQGTSAFNINLRFKTLGSGRVRVFNTSNNKVNPMTLTVMEVI